MEILRIRRIRFDLDCVLTVVADMDLAMFSLSYYDRYATTSTFIAETELFLIPSQRLPFVLHHSTRMTKVDNAFSLNIVRLLGKKCSTNDEFSVYLMAKSNRL